MVLHRRTYVPYSRWPLSEARALWTTKAKLCFHPLSDCNAKDEKCHNCSKQGHFFELCSAERQEASRTEGKTHWKTTHLSLSSSEETM